MSAGGNDGTANRPADPTAEEEEEGPSQAGSSLPAVELPRKRKGDVEERQSLDFQMDDDLSRSEGEDQQVKMKCFREPHSQIEKRRRDKMNNLIDELAAMIPACQPMARKLDKLTVLRKAVSHLKALKAGTSSAFTDTTYKPSILPHDDLRQLLLRAADGFLLVVSCDRAKILFTSESVSKILHFSRLELTGQSLFDFVHHKDINKVKEQLASSELYPRQRLIDAASESVANWGSGPGGFPRPAVPLDHRSPEILLLPDEAQSGGGEARGQTLAAQSFQKERVLQILHPPLHWIHAELAEQPAGLGGRHREGNLEPDLPGDGVPPPPSRLPPAFQRRQRQARRVRHALRDRRAATVIGYLPQEILGTSCYEYFHQDDLQQLAEKHRQALRSKEKIETPCYKFKTKYGVYVSLQSQWFSFTNPWTKEVEFIVSLNRVISGPTHTKDEEAGSSKALKEDTKQIPIIPSLSSGVGTMIYAGSIGTQIANELIDTYSRVNSSPSSGAPSPFGSAQEKGPLVSPQTSRSASSREEAAGSSSQSHSDSGTAAGASSAASESTGELSQLDLDSMVVPGLSSFSSDEAAMAVIMSLLETDVNMGQSGDFEDLHWPF